MDVRTVSTWVGLAVLLGGLIYAADNRFALAGGVTAQFNRHIHLPDRGPSVPGTTDSWRSVLRD